MRVESNRKPEKIHMEQYLPCSGMVELRIRENVTEAGERGMYTYDEYVFRIPGSPGLSEMVEQDLDNWLATGRAMEAGENTTLVADLRNALDLIVPGEKRGKELEMAKVFRKEIQMALQTVYDSLNPGQQQKLMKQVEIKKLFDQYGVEVTP